MKVVSSGGGDGGNISDGVWREIREILLTEDLNITFQTIILSDSKYINRFPKKMDKQV